LLSPNQATYIDLHFNEDLSLAEIAETRDISRQAVHDAIRHGVRSMQRFEDVLGLWSSDSSPGQGSESQAEIEDIMKRLRRLASEDIMYETDQLRKLLKQLEPLVLPKEREHPDV
jgi:predicted DNA-binding protein YlxM (UPF0122 family)